MKEEDIYIGKKIKIPAEKQEAIDELDKHYTAAVTAFHEASRMMSSTQMEFWKKINNTFPKLKGYQKKYNSINKEIMILSDEKEEDCL